MTTRGAASLRQRSPGKWEIRVSLGPDPVSGRSAYRSVTVHGDLLEAERRRALLAAQAKTFREHRQRRLQTVAELLDAWLQAQHNWKPATWTGYRLAAARLARDPLASQSPVRVSPPVLCQAMRRWEAGGMPTTTASLHARTLRAAFGWAFADRHIGCQPLEGFRGPAQPDPRHDVPVDVVIELLLAADDEVRLARAGVKALAGVRRLHIAEQVALLLRLAADTGARRGELDALRLNDLIGRQLRVERGVSAEIVTTTKTGRSRRITLGSTTVSLWQETVTGWRRRLPAETELGPWMFSAKPDHSVRLSASALAHWFAAFTGRHNHPDVCLHHLRHTVATVLVTNGQLLQAQQRLGHRDASTTLRQYCHAMPLHDEPTADLLDQLYAT